MNERLLDYDPVTGAKEWFSEDQDGNCFIRYEEDMTDVFDFCKEMQANDNLDKRSDMWHAAKLTNAVVMKMIVEHGVDPYNPDHKDGFRRLLNSDEFRYIRVNNFVI